MTGGNGAARFNPWESMMKTYPEPVRLKDILRAGLKHPKADHTKCRIALNLIDLKERHLRAATHHKDRKMRQRHKVLAKQCHDQVLAMFGDAIRKNGLTV